jgi:hypothetical protein
MNPELLAQKVATMARFEKARSEYLALTGHSHLLKRDPSDASIGTGNFTQGIPAFWFARSVDPGAMETLYTPFRDSAYVRRAIKYVSGPISSVDLVFSKPGTKSGLRRWEGRGRRVFTRRGIMQREAKSEVELPLFRQFLEEPMKELTYEDFVEASIGWMKIQECFWLLGDRVKLPFPEVDQSPYEPIIVARPDRMRPVLAGGQIAAWEFTDPNGKVWPLELNQVVRLFGWNPYNPHRGLGDYPSAAVAAESHWMAGKFKRQLTSDNDTAPMISAKNGTPTDTQIDQIKMQLAERRAAKMRGTSKTMFLPGEIDVHDPKVLSVDAAFISGMLEDRHEIFTAFGVPPSLADVKASYSIGQASDWFALIFNTCIPEGNKFCASLEKLILRLTGETVEVGLDWDEHYVMQQVRSERMKDAASLWGMGMPAREISEHLRLNLPQYENDDIGYVPINVTPTQSKEEIQENATTPQDFSEGATDNEDGPDDENEEVKAMLRALEARQSGSSALPILDKGMKELWESHMRLRSGTIRLYQSKVSKVFNDYRIVALRKLAAAQQKGIETKSLTDVVFNQNSFVSDLLKSLNPVQQAALQKSLDELYQEIGQPDNPWKMPPADVRDFIAARENKLSGVGETAWNQIKTTLDEGVLKGESTADLADRLRAVFNNLSKYESRRIATTETAAAYGYARNKGMVAAGITHKSWLSNHGPHVRAAHRAAEAEYGKPEKAIPIKQPFNVGGEALMYPGDPKGSAGNVINCHCVQLARQAPPVGTGATI